MPQTLDRIYHSSIQFRTIRQQVIERDNGICQYCGVPGHQVDYLIPPSHNGRPMMNNLVCCCAPCLRASNDATYPTLEDKIAFIIAHRKETGFMGRDGERIKGLDAKIPLMDQPVHIPPTKIHPKGKVSPPIPVHKTQSQLREERLNRQYKKDNM